MMPGSSNSTKFCVISIGVLFLALGACGGNTNAVKENEARNSTRSQAQRDMNQGLGGKNREEGQPVRARAAYSAPRPTSRRIPAPGWR